MSRKRGNWDGDGANRPVEASRGPDAAWAEDREGDSPEIPVLVRRVRAATTRHADEWLHVDAQIKRLIAKGKLG